MTKKEQLQQYLNESVLYATIGNNLDIYLVNESTILILDNDLKGFTIWEANTSRAVGWLHDFLRDIDESKYNDEQSQRFDDMDYWLNYSDEISLYKSVMF